MNFLVATPKSQLSKISLLSTLANSRRNLLKERSSHINKFNFCFYKINFIIIYVQLLKKIDTRSLSKLIIPYTK